MAESAVMTKTVPASEKRSKKKDPKLKKRVIDLRAERNLTYKDIAQKISKEFAINLTETEASEIYNAEMAVGTFVSQRGARSFQKQVDEMEDRFNSICKTMDRLHDAANKLMDEYEAKSENEMEAYIKFLKAAPLIVQITRQIQEQINFLQKEQERIKVEQKNVIFSTVQINQEVNKILKVLVREGKIEIKSPDVLPNNQELEGGKKDGSKRKQEGNTTV